MAGRDRRLRDKDSSHRTSVVGSKLSDTGALLKRRLPKGGIGEGEGLKLPDDPSSDTGLLKGSDEDGGGRSILQTLGTVAVALVGIAIIVALVIFTLSRTTAFTIEHVLASDTEHVLGDTVVQLAAVEEDETLLTVDVARIDGNVRKNPWVQSVSVERLFPDTLRIVAHERQATTLVSMGSGGLAWLLGSDDVWIEPVRIEVGSDESMSDAALREAENRGLLLITDVPATVNPVAGSLTSDEAIFAVRTYCEELSPSFLSQVVAFSAASEDDVSCILRNGVEVSLGSTQNIDTKESVAAGILSSWEGQVTYINVRVPSRPTYRRVNSEYVREGTGATGSSFDVSAIASKQKEDQEAEADEETTQDAKTQETAAGTIGNRSGRTAEDVAGTDESDDEGDSEDSYDTYDSYSDDWDYDSYGYDETSYDSNGDYSYDDYS